MSAQATLAQRIPLGRPYGKAPAPPSSHTSSVHTKARAAACWWPHVPVLPDPVGVTRTACLAEGNARVSLTSGTLHT